MSAASRASAPPRGDAPIRVMIVDDSVVVRGLIARWLTEAGGFDVVASHRTGRLAVDDMARADPDVVLLDIEMPDMDGIEALPLILERKRDCAVIMASTLTRRSAEISLKSLTLGALDYVPKPQSNRDLSTSIEFRRGIVDKVRHLGNRVVQKGRASTRATRREQITKAETALRHGASTGGFRPARGTSSRAGQLARERAAAAPEGVSLRPFPALPPRLLVIGASTGGPQALNTVISGIAPLIARVPVLVTQHMPATFTTILAEHLSRVSGHRAAEAVHGEAVRPGRIYVAPGARHMRLERRGGHAAIMLDDGPLINFCKPAVDPLFTSAAAIFGACVQALVLTGMGSDGTNGAAAIVAAGGSVIAQDEATSVVWGMPGAVAHAGHCSAVLPIHDIAETLMRRFAGDRP
jgi:two-component system, chemotaxis family, protein-glutamate methylesterase/glutaminase